MRLHKIASVRRNGVGSPSGARSCVRDVAQPARDVSLDRRTAGISQRGELVPADWEGRDGDRCDCPQRRESDDDVVLSTFSFSGAAVAVFGDGFFSWSAALFRGRFFAVVAALLGFYLALAAIFATCCLPLRAIVFIPAGALDLRLRLALTPSASISSGTGP